MQADLLFTLIISCYEEGTIVVYAICDVMGL